MPPMKFVFFAEADGTAPLLEWLDSLPKKIRVKIIRKIEQLGQRGYDMRRPDADYLGNDIYELRIRWMHVNYRVLYFFHDRIVVLSHGLTKEGHVPQVEIDRAVARLRSFGTSPSRHTYRGEIHE